MFYVVAAEVLASLALSAQAAEIATPRTFSFAESAPAANALQVAANAVYSDSAGYGFEPGYQPQLGNQKDKTGLCSQSPFVFSVQLPEGNYRVTVKLGAESRTCTTTVKAETRRLMAEQVKTQPGETVTRSFIVNIRTTAIAGGGSVRIKPREKDYLHWDNKLTLAFSGDHPAVQSITIAAAPEAPTVFLAGDSTVTDQPGYTYSSWGQSLPRFLNGDIAVANYAESGESGASFLAARRFDKILSVAKSGDYVMIQFGHNDQKDKSPGAGAFTNYKANLLKMIEGARDKGITPILITPVNRKTFDAEGKITNSLGDFPEAVRQLAAEQKVPLIDLNAMSKVLYEAWGPKEAVAAFAPKDGTHHNDYGSYELAKCVVSGLLKTDLKLREYVTPDFGTFDPASPDPRATFALPPDAAGPTTKPDGN